MLIDLINDYISRGGGGTVVLPVPELYTRGALNTLPYSEFVTSKTNF